MSITMMNAQEELWKVEAIVEPKVDWEKIKGKTEIASFKIGRGEAITFEKQLGNKTQFSVTVLCNDRSKVHDRAEFLSFLQRHSLDF